MQNHLFPLAVLLLPLTYGHVTNAVYSSVAKCNSTTISAIKAYWANNNGRPKDVLKKFEKSGDNILFHTSYAHKATENKCINVKSVNGILTSSFVPKDGGVAANLTFRAVEDTEGIIRGNPVESDLPVLRWNWYSVYFGNGITACYICSDLEGSKESPLVGIFVSKDAVNSSQARTTLSDLNNVLKGWGFDMRYNYEAECYRGNPTSSELVLGPQSKTDGQ